MSNPNPYDANAAAPAQPYQQVPVGDPNAAGNQQYAQPYQQNVAGQPGAAPYGQPDQQFVAGVPGYGQPDPAAGTWSKLSIASLVIGVAVFLISLFSGYVVMAILPIALGIGALQDIKKHSKKGKPLAIIGLVFGGLSAILYFIALIVG